MRSCQELCIQENMDEDQVDARELHGQKTYKIKIQGRP